MLAVIIDHVIFGEFVTNSIFNGFEEMEKVVEVFSKFNIYGDGVKHGKFIHD